MFRFLGLNSKPDTNIFQFRAVTNGLYGGIEIIGNGDTASIKLTDRNRRETKAILKVYNRQSLLNSSEFKNSMDDGYEESLVSTWRTRRSTNTIIKYAGNEQLAFVFTSEGKHEEIFKKLFSQSDFYCLDYFNETKFCLSLKEKTGLSIEALRNTPGITDKRVRLLYKNSNTFFTLLHHKVTIEQIAALNESIFKLLLKNSHAIKQLLTLGLTVDQLQHVNLSKLANCMNNSVELENALKLLTIQQILGINPTPKSIAEINATITQNNGMTHTPLVRGSESDDYSRLDTNTATRIKHEPSDTNFTIKFFKFEFTVASIPGIEIEKPEQIDLVHRWYVFPKLSNDYYQKQSFYCPDLKLMHSEKFDLAFPEEAFRNSPQRNWLSSTPYYAECNFVSMLEKLGHTVSGLKEVPGMSQEKIELLCAYQLSLEILMNAGIEITEFASVDLERLSAVLQNPIAAQHALKFVDARELLGIPVARKRYSQGLFDVQQYQSANDPMDIEPTHQSSFYFKNNCTLS